MSKTMTMVEYVDEKASYLKITNDIEYPIVYQILIKIEKFKDFLSSPIKLSDFIPCDENGNVLEKPYNFDSFLNGEIGDSLWKVQCSFYQKAVDNLVYEGFGVETRTEDFLYILNADKGISLNYELSINKFVFMSGETHEDLAKLRLTFTKKKAEELGL